MIVAGLDIETTGLKQAEGHRIIEVALQLVSLAERKALLTYVKRINPQRGIDPGAQAVHGISFEELTGEPLWEEIAPTVAKLLGKADIVVAHNGTSFDMPFITAELMRIGVAVPEVRLVDTMEQARWATPDGKLPNLAELCFATEVDYDPAAAHAALYDVNVMLAAFFKGLDAGFFRTDVQPFIYSPEKEK